MSTTMIYILFAISAHATGSMAIAEFNGAKACQEAAATIVARLESGRRNPPILLCLKKGQP